MPNQHDHDARGPAGGGKLVSFRVSERERAQIQKDARRVGLGVSRYIRAKLGLEDHMLRALGEVARSARG